MLSQLKHNKPKHRTILAAMFFAFCVAWSYTVGEMLEWHGRLLAPTIPSVLKWLILFIVTFFVTYFLWQRCGHHEATTKDPLSEKLYDTRTKRVLYTMITFVFFLGFYTVVLLCEYPGMWNYDAYRFLRVYTYHRMTTHVPVFYQVVLGWIVSHVAAWSGVNEIGIFTFIFLHVLMASGVFTFLLYEMRRYGVDYRLRLFTIIWLTASPPVALYVICSTKDTPFSIMLILAMILLYSMVKEPSYFFSSRPRQVFLMIALCVMFLTRKNGLYALIATLPFLIAIVMKKRRVLILLLLPVLVSSLISHAITAALSIPSGGRTEALPVPLQQIARTYLYHPEDFSEEEVSFLRSLQSQDVWDSYQPKIADSIKDDTDADILFSHLPYAVSLYLRQGVRHPVTYLEAWMMTSYGLWYPDAVMRNDVLTGPVEKTEYFWYPVDMPATRQPLFDRVDMFYRAVCEEQWVHEIPVIHLLLSPGFHTLFFLFTFLYLLQARRYKGVILLLFPGFVLATVLIGPCTMTRYALHLFMLFPILITVLFYPCETTGATNTTQSP